MNFTKQDAKLEEAISGLNLADDSCNDSAKLATKAICSANECTNTNTKKCKGGCKDTFYCSKECQKKDLKTHKKICPYFKKKEKKLSDNILHIDGVNNDHNTIYSKAVESLLSKDGPQIIHVNLPPKGSPSDFDIKRWTKFLLSDEWVKKATKDGIPYPKDWFICTEIKEDTDGQKMVSIRGSMGGGKYTIPWETPGVIKRVIP